MYGLSNDMIVNDLFEGHFAVLNLCNTYNS